MALYDAIAGIYDPWSRSVTEDIGFYVDEAVASGGPVVELAVGTGRIAVPTAKAGIRVIGIDQSEGMLSVARAYAERESVADMLDLRLGDMREPPVAESAPLVTIPFRSLLHMRDDRERLRALGAAKKLVASDGRVAFDVFTPSAEDIADTHGKWVEREPGIFERADWDEGERRLVLSVRGGSESATMELYWLSVPEWRQLLDVAGFEVEHLFGWFDRRPFEGGEDSIWIVEPRGGAAATSSPS